MSYADELLKRPRDGASYAGVFSGVISTTAADSTDLVSVIIDAIDGSIEYGPCLWQPRSDPTLPERGDLALIVFDNHRTPYVIAWWPQTVIPGGGGSDVRYTHTQAVAATTWTITHNLGLFPAVTLVDNSGNQIFADVNYASNNQVVVTFIAAQAGKAYLS